MSTGEESPPAKASVPASAAEQRETQRSHPIPPSDQSQSGAAFASLIRGRLVSEDVFGHPLQSFWQNLHRLPVAPAVVSRKRASLVGFRDLDWRKSAQEWLRYGRISTRYVARPAYEKPGKTAVLWDVSGSMADYLELYLPWLWRLVQLSRDVGVFPFGTQIEDATPQLRKPYRQARQALAQVPGLWVGGTSIGGVLREFQERFAPTWVRGRAALILISDGWDSGDPAQMVQVLRQWKRQGARIYWLNPLAASPGFEPRTRALKAAKPYVDGMLSGHSPQALRELFLD